MPHLPRAVITPQELAQLMGWRCVTTLYARMKKGTLPLQPLPRLGNRGRILFALADVEKLLGKPIDLDTFDTLQNSDPLDLELEAPGYGAETEDM